METAFLPALNAALNALAASLLLVGRRLARRQRHAEHKRVMVAAFCVSSLFLASYLFHKVSRDFENTTFHAVGWAKAAYLGLLATHVSLAMAVPVLAVTLIVLGLRGRTERHRRIARWAWPIWMYVSVTGVVIYLLLYHLNPAPVGAGEGELSQLALPAGIVAAAWEKAPLPVEKLNGVKHMRPDWKLENRSGVGYLTGGRASRTGADPVAGPSGVRACRSQPVQPAAA